MDVSSAGLSGSYKPGYIAVNSDTYQHATRDSRQEKKASEKPMLLSFPATRNILWDRRPIGSSINLHMNQYRNPSLIIEEKTLRLAHRFAQDASTDSYTCYLLASLTVNPDAEGICINVDRFETGNNVTRDELQSAYNIVIPCLVKKNSAKPKTSSEDYGESINTICERCRSKSKINLWEFLSMYAYCSYHENQQNFIFHVDFTMVTSGVRFKLTPVNSVPIVPTALSKNLAGPLSMSGLQGEPKSGYLTMDQTRKLLLVLESDPKVSTLPLVGLWVSGVSSAHDPFVWTSCLRYLFNSALEERVVIPPETFLVVVYTPIHSKPEFYECVTTDGSLTMTFDLSNGHEVIQMSKNSLGRAESPLEVELLAVESGGKRELFEEALQNNQSIIQEENTFSRKNQKHNTADDITPRSMPAPHFTRAPVLQPSVPEVSLLLDEKEGNFCPRRAPQPLRMSHAPIYPHSNANSNSTSNKTNVSMKKSKKNKKSDKELMMTAYSTAQNVQPLNSWNSIESNNSAMQYQVQKGGQMYAPAPQLQQNSAHQQRMPSNSGGMISAAAPQVAVNPMGNPVFYANNQMYYNSNAQAGLQSPHHYQPNLQYIGNSVQNNVPQHLSMYPQQYPMMYNNQVPQGPQSMPWNLNGYPVLTQNNIGSGNINGSTNTGPACNSIVNSQMGPNTGFGQQPFQESDVQNTETAGITVSKILMANNIQLQKNSIPSTPVINSGQNLRTGENTDNCVRKSPMNSPLAAKQANYHMPQSVINSSNANSSPQYVRNSQDYEETHVKQHSLSPSNPRSNPVSADNSPHHHSGSTDSGLHISDSPDPDAMNSTMESVQTSASVANDALQAHQQHQVPADVYELLREQDTQLKMLREQLSKLLAKQGGVEQGNEIANFANSMSQSDLAINPPPPPSLQSNVTSVATLRESRDMATQMSAHATPQKVRQQHQGKGMVLMDELSATNIESVLTNVTPSNSTRYYPEPEQVRRDAGNSANNSSLNLTTQEISIHAGNLDNLRGNSPMKYPKMGGLEYEGGGGTNISTDTISFGELHLTSHLQDRTEESIASEMIVDMPAYGSLSPEKRSSSGFTEDSNKSPMLGESVSMYERYHMTVNNPESPVEDEHDGSRPEVSLLYKNNKQFYQNLMGNVQKFLAKPSEESANNSQEENHSFENHQSEDCKEIENDMMSNQSAKDRHYSLTKSHSFPGLVNEQQVLQGKMSEEMEENIALRTLKQLQNMGVEFDNSSAEKSRIDQTSCFFDPVMLPKISYVSMMLDNDTDVSAEADALSMKYLSDEQLTELAKIRIHSSARSTNPNQGLDTILNSPSGNTKSNVTLYGIPSNHMSFASKEYLERYGLLGASLNDQSDRVQEYTGLNDSDSNNSTPLITPLKKNNDMLNVKEFLQKLTEKSFTDSISIPKLERTVNTDGMSHGKNTGVNYGDNTSLRETDDNDSLHHSDPGSFQPQGKPTSTPADFHQKPRGDFHSEITTEHSFKGEQNLGAMYPNNNNMRNNNNVLPLGAHFPEKQISEQNQRIFPELMTPQTSERAPQRPKTAAVDQFRVSNKNNDQLDYRYKNNVNSNRNSVMSKSVDNVLDIARLRELPKLL